MLNFESALPKHLFGPSKIQEFISEIKAPGVDVIWYDALTLLNTVHYQNGLTLLNAPYLHAADGLFTNYFWRDAQIWTTASMANAMGRLKDVFVGVDCYWLFGGFGCGWLGALL